MFNINVNVFVFINKNEDPTQRRSHDLTPLNICKTKPVKQPAPEQPLEEPVVEAEAEEPQQPPVLETEEMDEPSALPHFVRMVPVETQKPKRKRVNTTFNVRGETIKLSRFICGECGGNHRGDYMNTPQINARAHIPFDSEIVEASVCTHCCTDPNWGWLSGVLFYANQARENQVSYVERLMSHSPRNPGLVIKYFETKIFETSSEDLFKKSTVGWDLYTQALKAVDKDQKEESAKLAEKRANKIRTRIKAEKFDKARNTIRAARREFPNQWMIWDELENLIEVTESRLEREASIAVHRTKIEKAINDDDADMLVALIDFGSKNYPSINWNKFAEDTMAA